MKIRDLALPGRYPDTALLPLLPLVFKSPFYMGYWFVKIRLSYQPSNFPNTYRFAKKKKKKVSPAL